MNGHVADVGSISSELSSRLDSQRRRW